MIFRFFFQKYYNSNMPKQQEQQKWNRAIILVDMNAFFASIEQLDFPELRNKPIAVTNGKVGTCIITCSYEARKFGIKTGMRLKEAKALCPSLIQVASRPERYTEISMRIMEALEQVTPTIEIFSVDEAFLDVTHCQNIYPSPIDAAKLTQKIIHEVSGLPCSIGLSGDKTTAKYAAEVVKPNGFTVIPPWEAKETLANVPVTKLCGIGKGTANFLAQYGVIYCKDLANMPISIVAKRFGNLGRKMWLMCQGMDPDPVHTTVPPAKSLGHGKVLPPNTHDIETLKIYLRHMAEKVAARLRRNNMFASKFFIGMRSQYFGWLAINHRTPSDTNSGKDIYFGCKKLLQLYPNAGNILQVQITATDPKADLQQLELLDIDFKRRTLLENTIDNINQKFGEFTVKPAILLGKSEMPNVIAPAWRPSGVRKSL